MKPAPSLAAIAALALSACASTPSTLPAEKPLADQAMAPAEKPPAVELPLQAIIVEAVTRQDLEALKALLDGVDDVRPLVSPDTRLLHLSELNAGGGMASEVTRYLVAKKAYVLQRDEQGRGVDRVISGEMAGTPRHDYLLSLVGSKWKEYYQALQIDSVEEFDRFAELRPVTAATLLEAAHYKAGRIAQALCAAGVAIDGVDAKTGENALHKALNNHPFDHLFDDRLELVRALLEAKVDLEKKDSQGRTPLLTLLAVAASDSNKRLGSPVQLAKLLLARGADVSARDAQQLSALYFAANRKDLELLEAIAARGAELDDPKAIQVADDAAMALLLDKGVPAERFAKKIAFVSDPQKQLAFVKLLLEKGLSAEAIDPQQAKGNFEAIRLLVEKGAQVGKSKILVNPVVGKDLELAKYLLAHGADLAMRYPAEKTILHLAGCRELPMVTLLVEAGADVNAEDARGGTPLDGCGKSDEAVREYLVAKGARSGAKR